MHKEQTIEEITKCWDCKLDIAKELRQCIFLLPGIYKQLAEECPEACGQFSMLWDELVLLYKQLNNLEDNNGNTTRQEETDERKSVSEGNTEGV